MLLRPAGSEHGVEPVVFLAVPYTVELGLGELADIHLVVDIVLGSEQFRPLAEHLARKAEVVGHMRGTALVGTALCRNEYDTIYRFPNL